MDYVSQILSTEKKNTQHQELVRLQGLILDLSFRGFQLWSVDLVASGPAVAQYIMGQSLRHGSWEANLRKG